MLFDMYPHKWDDGDFLKDLACTRARTCRPCATIRVSFVRDDFWLYDRLKQDARGDR
jgi:hypothetical protein